MPRVAQDIMNRELLGIRPDLPAAQALDLLRTFRVGALPILDEARHPLGVVSLSDLLEPGGTAAERMSRPAVCIASSAPVESAARLLARSDMHHVIVVDATGAAVGMISTLDALRALLDLPTRHPATFPHWDDSTKVSWTDDWLLDDSGAPNAPQGPGILALSTDHLGEGDSLVWAEACGNVRARVLRLLGSDTGEESALRRVLTLRGLRFRAAEVADEAAREQIVHLLRDRIAHAPPPGAP